MQRKSIALFFMIILVGYLSAKEKKTDIAQLYSEGNYDRVIAFADSCLLHDSTDFALWYYKGLAQKSLYRYNQAVSSFEKALPLTEYKSPVLFLLGNVLESSGNDIEATQRYKELLALDSTHFQANARLAHVYKSQKEYLLAVDQFSNLVKMDSSNGYFYAQLAYCCNKLGLTEPVIFYYEKAMELNPDDIESGRNLINELINQKYYEDATFWVDFLLLRFNNNLYLLKQKAYISAIGGNYLDAVNEFQNVVDLGDSSMFTAKYYGQSLYNNGQYDKAIYWLNKYVNSNQDDTKNQFILGLAYQKDYQYRKSLEHLHIALGLVYDKELIARVYTETGNTYGAFGDYLGFRDSTGIKAPEMYDLAIKNYLYAKEMVPDDFEQYKRLGYFYETKMKDPKMALYYYEKYYKEMDTSKIDEMDLIWIQSKLTSLKEKIHFIGD